jgi:alpha-tubulin suppressor-like RCC1 family protein
MNKKARSATHIFFSLLSIFVTAVSAVPIAQAKTGVSAGFEQSSGPDSPLQISEAFNFTRITAGESHTCARTTSGGVKCWGLNEEGQLGDGTFIHRSLPVGVSGLGSGVAVLAAGHHHTCVVTGMGGVKCWGMNFSGQLGNDSTVDSNIPVNVVGLDSGVIAVEAGDEHTCALTSSGGVKCWGWDGYGQLGNGTSSGSSSTPVDVVGLNSGVVAIATGGDHTCALTTTGSVKCWGLNGAGQLGDGTDDRSHVPIDVIGLSSGVIAVAAGDENTCAIINGGGLKCWGSNWAGQLGDGTSTNRKTPVDVVGLSSGVLAVSVGRNGHTCALITGSGMKCWGNNSSGELGNGTMDRSATPSDVIGLAGGVSAIATGYSHTCALTISGAAKCWGSNDDSQLGIGLSARRTIPGDVAGLDTNITSVDAGWWHTCAVTSVGGAKCWGDNNSGGLGDGSETNRNVPVDVSGLTGSVLALASGNKHTCALTTNGSVKCWGDNGVGQLGDSTTTRKLIPVDVTGLSSGVTAISAGGFHTCALMTNGGVKCWGYNGSGQLGDGTYNNRNEPVDVSGLTSNVTALATGWDGHTCALTTSGGVLCWGNNSNGQLGDGSLIGQATPQNVSGLTSGITTIMAGGRHTCAITTATGMKCWGANSDGQLGDGSFFDHATPQNVSGLTSGVVGMATGGNHTCAIMINGTAKCWGNNYNGQVGDGTYRYRNTPVVVTGLMGAVSALTAGDAHTCASLTSGRVKCWGWGVWGQLGVGPLTNFSTPVNLTGVPPLSLNYAGGKSGSYLTLTGESFPVDGSLTLSVNNAIITTTLSVNETGGFIIFLDTAQLPSGHYIIKAGLESGSPVINNLVGFMIDENSPIHAQEGGGIVLTLGNLGIDPLLPGVFLPLITR